MVPTNPIIIATEQSDAQTALDGVAPDQRNGLRPNAEAPLPQAGIPYRSGAYDSRDTQ